jgi:hypothetical protein
MVAVTPGRLIEYVRTGLYGGDGEKLANEFGMSPLTLRKYESSGGPRWMRFALIGLLESQGKPYGVLWPEN